jgi:hypothetical protein
VEIVLVETVQVGDPLYVKEPMGLNNAAYDVVRQAKLQDAFVKAEARDHNDAPPGCCSLLGMGQRPSERFILDCTSDAAQ